MKITNIHVKMSLKIKHIGLIISLLATIVSFLFHGHQHNVYLLLLMCGILASSIFFIIIILGKGSIKYKLFWTAVIVFSIIIQWLTEPLFVKYSYLFFLHRNRNDLTTANNILSKKTGIIFIIDNEVTDQDSVLTLLERKSLIKLREKLHVYMISKSDNGIHYGLWGFLDVRLGITYWTMTEKPLSKYQHLEGKWYY